MAQVFPAKLLNSFALKDTNYYFSSPFDRKQVLFHNLKKKLSGIFSYRHKCLNAFISVCVRVCVLSFHPDAQDKHVLTAFT